MLCNSFTISISTTDWQQMSTEYFQQWLPNLYLIYSCFWQINWMSTVFKVINSIFLTRSGNITLLEYFSFVSFVYSNYFTFFSNYRFSYQNIEFKVKILQLYNLNRLEQHQREHLQLSQHFCVLQLPSLFFQSLEAYKRDVFSSNQLLVCDSTLKDRTFLSVSWSRSNRKLEPFCPVDLEAVSLHPRLSKNYRTFNKLVLM